MTSVGRASAADEGGAHQSVVTPPGLATRHGVPIPARSTPTELSRSLAYDLSRLRPCKVPFLARWDGVLPAGAADPRLVAGLDILPTVLDAAGASPELRYPPRRAPGGCVGSSGPDACP